MHDKSTNSPRKTNRVERHCPICESVFYATPSEIRNGRGKTCSPACGYERIRRQTPKVHLECAVCGKGFTVKKSYYRNQTKASGGTPPTYCSIQCAHSSPEWSKNLGESLRNSAKAKAARAKAIAAMIEYVQSDEGKERRREQALQQFSDPESRAVWEAGIERRSNDPEWRSAEHFQRGTAHPRYRGNKTPEQSVRVRYEAKRWRRDVLNRDNHTCQHCGHQGEGLHAHHIKPWRDFPEQRYELSNGLTLCEQCHRQEHKKE